VTAKLCFLKQAASGPERIAILRRLKINAIGCAK
jgi:hypothetical protein